MKSKVYITNIHFDPNFPNTIYAHLIELETNFLCINSTLNYIFEVIKTQSKIRNYDCVNVKENKFGGLTIIDGIPIQTKKNSNK